MDAPPGADAGAPPAGAPPGAGGPPGGPPPLPFGIGLPVPPLLFAGPVLIGVLFTWLLYGVFITQLAQYSQTVAKTDRKWLKALVVVVFIIQTIHLAFITDNAWTVCVLSFLEPMKMVSPPVSAPGTGILNGMVSFCVQGFFAWKIYSLAPKNKLVACASGLVALFSFIQFGASIGISTMFILVGRRGDQLFKLKLPISIHLATTAACDVLITVSMITILSHYKVNTSFRRTKSLLNTLIVATIENGLVTTVTALGNLIVFFARTQDMTNIAFQYVIGGLYAIVLITTLNRRQTDNRQDGTSISLSSANAFTSSRTHPANIATGRGAAPSYQVNVLGSVDDRTTVDGLRRAEAGKAQPDIMVSVSREIHGDHPYAMSSLDEKH